MTEGNKTETKKMSYIFIVTFLWFTACAGLYPAWGYGAAKEGMGDIDFNDDDRYDVYFEYEVIKGIKILGTKEISGETFLIVSNSNLRTKGTEGYILFSSIKAILPSGYFSAIQNPYIQYK